MARLNGLQVFPEDVFCESARLLDFLLSTPDISQHQVDSLWNLMLLDIRNWKSDATDHDKRMVANTVFLLVRALLTQYYDTHFSETVCDLLENTIGHEWIGFDKQEDKDEYSEFSNRLVEQSPILSDWINQYDDADVWLSDQIAEILVSSDEKEVKGMSKAAILTENKEFMRILHKAVEQGFCTQQGWQYHWKVKVEAAYFASVASQTFNLSNRKDHDGEIAFAWKPFEALFNLKDLRLAYNDIQQCKTKVKRKADIDKLFK